MERTTTPIAVERRISMLAHLARVLELAVYEPGAWTGRCGALVAPVEITVAEDAVTLTLNMKSSTPVTAETVALEFKGEPMVVIPGPFVVDSLTTLTIDYRIDLTGASARLP